MQTASADHNDAGYTAGDLQAVLNGTVYVLSTLGIFTSLHRPGFTQLCLRAHIPIDAPVPVYKHLTVDTPPNSPYGHRTRARVLIQALLLAQGWPEISTCPAYPDKHCTSNGISTNHAPKSAHARMADHAAISGHLQSFGWSPGREYERSFAQRLEEIYPQALGMRRG